MSDSYKLLDIRMADGSRHFAEIDWRDPVALRHRLLLTPGVTVVAFVNALDETWIDFTYAGHQFSLHDPLQEFWVFVCDPGCPDQTLRAVLRLLA